MRFHGQSTFLSSVKHHEPSVKRTIVQNHFKSGILEGILTEDESELEILNLGLGLNIDP